MRTIFGLFDDHKAAKQAAEGLEKAGFSPKQITVLTKDDKAGVAALKKSVHNGDVDFYLDCVERDGSTLMVLDSEESADTKFPAEAVSCQGAIEKALHDLLCLTSKLPSSPAWAGQVALVDAVDQQATEGDQAVFHDLRRDAATGKFRRACHLKPHRLAEQRLNGDECLWGGADRNSTRQELLGILSRWNCQRLAQHRLIDLERQSLGSRVVDLVNRLAGTIDLNCSRTEPVADHGSASGAGAILSES
jgi:hypothetical protein